MYRDGSNRVNAVVGLNIEIHDCCLEYVKDSIKTILRYLGIMLGNV